MPRFLKGRPAWGGLHWFKAMKTLLAFVGFLTILLLAFASVCSAQCDSPNKGIPSAVPPNIAERTKWDWTNDKWTGDSRPYEAARRQIDQAVARGQNLEILIQKYRTAVEQGPRIRHNAGVFYDPLLCYQWGYAAWKTITPSSLLSEQAKHLSGVSGALASTESPHTYEYSRLRFFVAAWHIPSSHLQGIGVRLVRHTPADLDVKYQMTRVLSQSVTPKNNHLALSYAKDLVRLRPKRPSSYAALGSVYQDSWLFLDNKADAPKALAAYQHCLALMPPSTEWRDYVVTTLSQIKAEIARKK